MSNPFARYEPDPYASVLYFCLCRSCVDGRAAADWSGYAGGPRSSEPEPVTVAFESLPEGAFFSNAGDEPAATLFVKRAGQGIYTAVWVYCEDDDNENAGKPCCIEPSRAVIPRELLVEFD